MHETQVKVFSVRSHVVSYTYLSPYIIALENFP